MSNKEPLHLWDLARILLIIAIVSMLIVVCFLFDLVSASISWLVGKLAPKETDHD